MKKLIIVLAIIINYQSVAQPVEMDNKNLFVLGKVWGLLKYYHPAVSTGKYNWDEELKKQIPLFRNIKSPAKRNDSLLTWIRRLGPVPECSKCMDSLPGDIAHSPDFSWTDKYDISAPLAQTLKDIIRNHAGDQQHYLKFMEQEDISLALPQQESAYSTIAYPDSVYGLVSLFRFWNIIEYWYPYKYLMTGRWDEVLQQFIPRMQVVKNANEYVAVAEELVTSLNDGHGFVRATAQDSIYGKFILPFTITFIEGKWVVSSVLVDSLSAGIKKGDILESIDGISIKDKVRQLSKTTPASNEVSLMNKLSYKLTRIPTKDCKVQVSNNNVIKEVKLKGFQPSLYAPPDLNPAYFSFAKDSSYCYIKPGIVYVNMGRLDRKDSAKVCAMIQSAKGLIIDNRQNADEQHGTGAGDIIGEMIMQPGKAFVKFSSTVRAYPGYFRYTKPMDMGITGKGLYTGPIILLVNENTISVGEFMTMAFMTAPRVKIVGTTTAGADGNVSYIILPGNVFVQYSGLGIYFPDGRETQRKGIKPDIMVKQTLKGFMQNRDEQLEAAIQAIK